MVVDVLQTGSGKTYTLWGPPSAMVDDQSTSGNQGIIPRIFQMLFAEIQRVSDYLFVSDLGQKGV